VSARHELKACQRFDRGEVHLNEFPDIADDLVARGAFQQDAEARAQGRDISSNDSAPDREDDHSGLVRLSQRLTPVLSFPMGRSHGSPAALSHHRKDGLGAQNSSRRPDRSDGKPADEIVGRPMSFVAPDRLSK
jgi:hypothetical protein